MKKIILVVLSFCLLSFGAAQDTLMLGSGEIVVGDILRANSKKVIIDINGEHHRFPRANTQITYGAYYLSRARLSVSAFIGGDLLGTGAHLRALLEQHDFDEYVDGFFGPIQYPTSNSAPPMFLNMEYLIKPDQGMY